jgi:hypothetical protein
VNLSLAANGYLQLTMSPLSAACWRWKLALTHGSKREGRPTHGLDEAIYPDFVRGDLRLMAGWDIWSDHYLLSSSEAGDEFLRALAAR